MFLAMLELVRLQAIQVRQDKLFGEIAVRKHIGFEAVMAEQAAVRDDWR
jgi:segregation and condensation protein A